MYKLQNLKSKPCLPLPAIKGFKSPIPQIRLFRLEYCKMSGLRTGFLTSARKMSTQHNLVLDNMNPCIKKMEYAVRGPLVIRANQIEKVRFF